MLSNESDDHRWKNYVLLRGDALDRFWTIRLHEKPRTILFILGQGFDPRMCHGLSSMQTVLGPSSMDILLLDYNEGERSPSHAHESLVTQNIEKVTSLGRTVLNQKLQMWSGDGRRIGARSATAVFQDAGRLTPYDDIVLDVSALPQTLYLPLIYSVLHVTDSARRAGAPSVPNIHVFVAENAALDRQIREEGVDERADYLHPFAGGIEREARATVPRLWVPLLGEGQATQLARIYDRVLPSEIVPVLPSPARDPRRADNLVLEYRELLFDRLRVEPRDLVYASETNPFELYRRILVTVLRYEQALAPLGGCETAISVLSSKLMSVGALLAAYELKQAGSPVGIAHVEAQGFVMESDEDPGETELYDLWLAGECHANS